MDEGAEGVTNLSAVISVMDENVSVPLLDPEKSREKTSLIESGTNTVFVHMKTTTAQKKECRRQI